MAARATFCGGGGAARWGPLEERLGGRAERRRRRWAAGEEDGDDLFGVWGEAAAGVVFCGEGDYDGRCF